MKFKLLVSASFASILSISSVSATDFQKVEGDSPCSSGYSLVNPNEVKANYTDICSMLGSWDIVRLANGASLDGPGYGCKMRANDTRKLGHSLCKQPTQFTARARDYYCEAGETMVSSLVANAHSEAACDVLGDWYIARLLDGGAMDGPGYGCNLKPREEQLLGHTLCATYSHMKVSGDVGCPSGTRLATPAEAEKHLIKACLSLDFWDVARLAGGGSMDGIGYGCQIRANDSRALGHSLCVAE
ncbi:hypothetical protein [Spartinivicinus poritis]|uniref:Uncharacterized protein n=1 Tax=Spartinivicinus poritis TaxID=2994640 RepID=A0ABT5U2U4_9GAMM|nr:hypothetical protein [Spartinivicinus sp. A2-2]MDE1460687.1 hypothetical protein [Spartinivicinus sp. A2-2]